MKTLILEDTEKAAEIIKKGGLVAFPTETVYGLGASAFNKKAIDKIFKVKGRKQDNPLIIHISNLKQLNEIAENIPRDAEKLIEKFWPGPLTMVLKKKKIIPDNATANLDTVAVRMPKNKIALELIERAGPIAAPSANLSGKPSTTSFEHVFHDMNNKIDAIIKDEDSEIGLESTVVDLSTKNYTMLRPGKITIEELRKVIKIRENKNFKISKSPGMKYKHYSPKAKVIIVKRILKKYIKDNTAIISLRNYDTKEKFIAKDLEDLAKNLFKKFREFDEKNIKEIYFEAVKEEELGTAIMNRVKKAAGK